MHGLKKRGAVHRNERQLENLTSNRLTAVVKGNSLLTFCYVVQPSSKGQDDKFTSPQFPLLIVKFA